MSEQIHNKVTFRTCRRGSRSKKNCNHKAGKEMEHYSQLICIFPETADKRPGAQLRLTPPPPPSSSSLHLHYCVPTLGQNFKKMSKNFSFSFTIRKTCILGQKVLKSVAFFQLQQFEVFGHFWHYVCSLLEIKGCYGLLWINLARRTPYLN